MDAPVTSKYGRTPPTSMEVLVDNNRTECGIFVMYCMQCCMYMSTVL